MIKEPMISIIVPVYNVEKYLEDCLNSLLSQSYRKFEIICINDGSTDNSLNILKRYEKQDARIIVIIQENQGLSEARNTGLKNARGEYVCFVDSDDMFVPGALQILRNAVLKDDVDIVGYETAPLLYESEELKIKENKDEYYLVRNEYPGVRSGREFFVEMIENNDFVDSAWLVMIRKQWLDEQGVYFCKGMFYEDSAFIIQCYFSCKKMKHIKDRLYIYRIRKNSIMTTSYTFKHQLSRIWQFSECLRAIYTFANTEQEVKALAAFANISMVSTKHIDYRLEIKEKEKIEGLDSLYGLLAKTMDLGKMHYNRELSLEGLLTVMQGYSHIILYGAGLVGMKTRNFIEIKGMGDKFLGFGVSNEQEPNLKNGKWVRYIGDYEPTDDTLVIISARESYHKAMADTAKMLGFQKIYVINYEMECVIDATIN